MANKPYAIEWLTTIQIIRNDASHGGNISKAECQQVRDLIIGIGQESIMGALIKTRN